MTDASKDTLRDVKYVPRLEQPGEQLLLPGNVLDLVEKFQHLRRDSGMDSFVITRIVSSPLVRDYAGNRPTVAYAGHPLMWLPERLIARYEEEDGSIESDDHWALRIMLEMMISGMYDETQGWVDVIDLAGFNMDDPNASERVERWCDGAADDILDAFSLEPYLLIEQDPLWSYDLATQMLPQLHDVSIGLVAASIAKTSREALEAPVEDGALMWDDESRSSVVATMMAAGAALLSDVNAPMAASAAACRNDPHPQNPDSSCWQAVSMAEQLAEEYREVESDIIAELNATLAEGDDVSEDSPTTALGEAAAPAPSPTGE